MARMRKDAPPAAEQLAELEDEKSLTSTMAAQEFLGQFAGVQDLRCAVLRRNADTGKWEYVRTHPTDVVDEDFIRRQYGPGSYKLVVRGPKSDKAPNGYYGSHVEDIADLTPTTKDTPASTESGMEKMLAMMLQRSEQQNANMMQLLLAAIQNIGRPAAGSDPLAVVELAQKISAMGSNAIPPEQYIKDRADSYDAGLGKGLEIGKREGARGGSDDNWPSVIRELAGPAIEAIGKAAPMMAPPPVQPRIAAPPGAPPPVQEVRNVNEPKWFVGLRKWLPMVGFAANNGMAPEKAAAMVMEQVGDDDYDGFVDDVLGPDFVARMTPLLPAVLVQRFPEWTAQVLQAIRAAVEEEQRPDDQPPEGAEPEGSEAS